MEILKAKKRIEISNESQYQKLYQYLIHVESTQMLHNSIEVRITEHIEFIKPAEVLIIVQFIISLSSKNVHINIISPPRLHKYFKDIAISEFCNSNYKQSETFDAITSQTAMPIRRVVKERMAEYIQSAELYFNGLCKNKDLFMFNLCFSELLNNVYDHSKSEIDAYVFCQYFPRLNTIKIAVADLGITIPGSIRMAEIPGINLDDELECLNWALKRYNSIKSLPNNMGMGLSNVIDFATTNLGTLVLLSGSSMALVKDGALELRNNPYTYFKGTLIQLELVINNLQEIDEEFVEY